MRWQLGLHRTLRWELLVRGSVLLLGVALLAATPFAYGRMKQRLADFALPGLGAFLVFAGVKTMRDGWRLRNSVVACAAGADAITLRVLSHVTTTDQIPLIKMRLKAEEDGATSFDYRVVAQNGEPHIVSDDPPRIAALQAHADPSIVVPFLTTGYPFKMSKETRLEIVDWAGGA